MYFVCSLLGILVVLALHNAGYLIAMRALGIHDPEVYLWPRRSNAGYGAGTLTLAPAWKQLVVLLAGPAPALLFNSVNALLASGPWTWLLHRAGPTVGQVLLPVSIGLFFINWLSLLPFKPLPGGRLVDLLWGGSRNPQFVLAGLLLLLWPMRMDLMSAILILGSLIPAFICLTLTWLVTWRAAVVLVQARQSRRVRARGPILVLGTALYLVFYCSPLILKWVAMLETDPPWRRIHLERAENAKAAALRTRIAAAKSADERVALYLDLADVLRGPEARQALHTAFTSIARYPCRQPRAHTLR